jgi:hypothetical protein
MGRGNWKAVRDFMFDTVYQIQYILDASVCLEQLPFATYCAKLFTGIISFILFIFLGGTGDCIQGLVLARLLNHAPSPFRFSYFSESLSLVCPGHHWIVILLPKSSTWL